MKRKPTKNQPTKTTEVLTISRFAEIMNADRHAVAKAIEEIGAAPAGKAANGSPVYQLRSLVNALMGGDLEAERIRKTRAEAERIELQNFRTRGELVEIASVKKLGERIMIAIRAKILGFRDLSAAQQDSLLLELYEMRKIDWTRDA